MPGPTRQGIGWGRYSCASTRCVPEQRVRRLGGHAKQVGGPVVRTPTGCQGLESGQRDWRLRVQPLTAEERTPTVGQLQEYRQSAAVAAAPQGLHCEHPQFIADRPMEGDCRNEIDELAWALLRDRRKATVYQARVFILEGGTDRPVPLRRHAQLQANRFAAHPHIGVQRPSRRRESLRKTPSALQKHEQIPIDKPTLISKARHDQRAKIDRRVSQAVK